MLLRRAWTSADIKSVTVLKGLRLIVVNFWLLEKFFPVLHWDTSSKVVGALPMFPALRGLGDTSGKISPCPPLRETCINTWGNVSPVWGTHFPKRGTSEQPPHPPRSVEVCSLGRYFCTGLMSRRAEVAHTSP